MILLATHRRATEVDRIIDAFREDDVEFARLNMGYGESSTAFLMATGEAPRFVAECDGRTVASGDISAAWYHQPPILDSVPGDAGAGRVSALTSFLNMWIASLETVGVPWLNGPRAVHAAGNKLTQLATAAQVGLAVPRSSAGTSGDLQREHHGAPTVAKNLADLHLAWALDPGIAFLTKSIDVAAMSDGQIASVPVLFQELLVPVREFRVVFVGEQYFAVALDHADRGGVVDIRTVAGIQERFRPANLPAATVEGMRALLQAYGLGFCSADIIETEDGIQYFIDLNACGSWWWVDDHFEGAVTKSIAAMLVSLSGSRQYR